MSQVWLLAAVWVGLPLTAVLVTIKFNQAQYLYIVATMIASAMSLPADIDTGTGPGGRGNRKCYCKA
jgi:hypothetical protein